MKYELTQDDKQVVEMFIDNHPLAALLKEYAGWKFNIGDVLIRYYKRREEKYQLDFVSETCKIPKKFRVVYIDDLGVPWVKQMSVRGGLGKKFHCLATDSPTSWHYEVDPEQVEAIILGRAYDPREDYRRMRNENPEYGGKS